MAKKVKDTELYDILGVAPEATDIECVASYPSQRGCADFAFRLKKSYRKLAVKVHSPSQNCSSRC